MSSVIPSIFQRSSENIRPHSLIGIFGIHRATLKKKKNKGPYINKISIMANEDNHHPFTSFFSFRNWNYFCKYFFGNTPPPHFFIYLFSVLKFRFLLYKMFHDGMFIYLGWLKFVDKFAG